MDSNGKASKNGEIGMTENNNRSGEVHVMISGEEKPKNSVDSHPGVAKSLPPISFPSPDGAHKPPKIPRAEMLTRRKSLTRSVYSKPKSRFGEQSLVIDSNMFEEEHQASKSSSPNHKVKETIRSVSFASSTPNTPFIGSPRVGGVDEGEEISKKMSVRNMLKYKRVKLKVLIEWVAFICIIGCLVASFIIDKFGETTIWGLEIWKWSVLVLVTFCGMLLTKWFMDFIVFLIELNFLLKKKVLYFVHGLKKSVRVCLWLSLILATWALLFHNEDIDRSPIASKILHIVAWTIITLLIGSFLWVIKTLLLKILASTFHVNTFFDRIQESIFHQYVLQTLSGPPLLESAEMIGRTNSVSEFSFRSTKGKEGNKREKVEVIDMNKLHRMKQEQVSAWTMKTWIDLITNSRLSTLSKEIDECDFGEVGEQTDKEITSKMEAIAAAYHIFVNVAPHGYQYNIEEMDLRRFLTKEQVDVVFPLIDVADTGQIDRKALIDWVVKVYNGRKALSHALKDTKTAVKQLDKLVTAVLIVTMIIVWLILLEIATTKVLVLLSTQLVAAAFIFENACKTIFESIIFVFVTHPFDVGDRCVIDGVQMIVEEMNILTTVFLKFDNEKIYYPNSVLSTKPIGNFYRSPDMGDAFEFSIDFATPVEKIGVLKKKIKMYIQNNNQYWHPSHSMVVKEIENVNKINMALYFSHTMNFQEFGEKTRRRTELVLEMKRIFEELNIAYNLLPQEVHIVQRQTTTIGTSR